MRPEIERRHERGPRAIGGCGVYCGNKHGIDVAAQRQQQKQKKLDCRVFQDTLKAPLQASGGKCCVCVLCLFTRFGGRDGLQMVLWIRI